MNESTYNNDYATCEKTYVTLRIYFENMNSEKLTEYLEINPTRFQNSSDETHHGKVEFNSWFLSTKNELSSKDCRQHIDFITEKILPVLPKIKSIMNEGAKIDLSCYWLSKDGHGGPTLSVKQFANLSKIGIDLWFDIY